MRLYAYVLAAMLSWLPPNPSNVSQLRAYTHIAAAVAAVTQDPREALLLVSIAGFESSFHERAVGRLGEQGAWQLMPPAPKTLKEQAAEALKRIRWSYAVCGSLAGFTSGQCYRGLEAARHRVERARQWAESHPFIEEGT